MPGIITITFSPCIDKSTSVQTMVHEKKLGCAAPKLEPGGGGINVARAIHKLGGQATAIFPSGGYTGKFFNSLMKNEGIPSIIIDTENETRENIIILEKSTNRQYRFGMPGMVLKVTEWQQILKAIEEIKDVDFIVASGSLPPGVPVDIFAQIASIAKTKKARLIADTSGEALKKVISTEIYLIKPSLRELCGLVNKEHLLPDEIADTAREILKNSLCENIVVSMGSGGAMLVTKDIIQTFTPPSVNLKSTVGAGDSMVAGIVLSLAKGKNIKEATRFGVASGTAATLNPGTELCRKEEAERLYGLIVDKGISMPVICSRKKASL